MLPPNQANKTINNKQQSKPEVNFRVFIALFDYDPIKMSPNTDSCSEELPFSEGQIIKVYGDQDADGFYYGESNGRSGYIPCNMISEMEDQDIVRQVISDHLQQQQKLENRKGSVIKTDSSNKLQPGKQQQQQTVNQSNKSFVPVKNNYQYNNNKQQQQQTKQNQPPQQQQQLKKIVMIALYDYDPQSLSPNPDIDVNKNLIISNS